MSQVLQTKLIILKKTKYSEADLVLQALLPTGARISILARGALKSKKRFGGGILEPTHHLQAQIKKPKQESGMYTLEEAQLIHGFDSIRTSYEKIEFALSLLEIISRISQEGDTHSESLYNLLGHTLTVLGQTTDLNNLKLHFGLKLLYNQGVLDQEPWMGPYLSLALAHHSELKTKPQDFHYVWLEAQIQRYLETAEH